MKTRFRGLMTAAALGATLALTVAGPVSAGSRSDDRLRVARAGDLRPVSSLARWIWSGIRAVWANNGHTIVGGGVVGDE
jgi:hypothetical protein